MIYLLKGTKVPESWVTLIPYITLGKSSLTSLWGTGPSNYYEGLVPNTSTRDWSLGFLPGTAPPLNAKDHFLPTRRRRRGGFTGGVTGGGGLTNGRAGSDHVTWGPMRGLGKSYMKRGQINRQPEGQTSRLYERIGQGPILWKYIFREKKLLWWYIFIS